MTNAIETKAVTVRQHSDSSLVGYTDVYGNPHGVEKRLSYSRGKIVGELSGIVDFYNEELSFGSFPRVTLADGSVISLEDAVVAAVNGKRGLTWVDANRYAKGCDALASKFC